jgi:hypothetical protein
VLIAAVTQRDGRKLLVLGLVQENIDRLLDDRPIRRPLDESGVLGFDGWDVSILGPEDTARFLAQFNPDREGGG